MDKDDYSQKQINAWAFNLKKKVGKTLFKEGVRKLGAYSCKSDAYRLFAVSKSRKNWKTKAERNRAAADMLQFVHAISRVAGKRSRRISSVSCPTNFWDPNSVALSLPSGPLVNRLLHWKREIALRSITQNGVSILRYSGTTTYEISFGDNPRAETFVSKGEVYSSRCSYRKTNAIHEVQFSTNWLLGVYKKGLCCVGGLTTLSAEELEPNVFRACWIRKKGKRLVSESGYIVICMGEAAHGASVASARSTLTRRFNARKRSRWLESVRRALIASNSTGYDDVHVNLLDSLSAGNCLEGTEDFRDAYFAGRDSVSVREILNLSPQRPEALAACLQAIRRSRSRKDQIGGSNEI